MNDDDVCRTDNAGTCAEFEDFVLFKSPAEKLHEDIEKVNKNEKEHADRKSDRVRARCGACRTRTPPLNDQREAPRVVAPSIRSQLHLQFNDSI